MKDKICLKNIYIYIIIIFLIYILYIYSKTNQKLVELQKNPECNVTSDTNSSTNEGIVANVLSKLVLLTI